MKKLALFVLMLNIIVSFSAAAAVFSDDFDDGDISDWTKETAGTGVIEVSTDKCVSSPYSLHMKSLTSGDKAIGTSAVYDVNLLKDYDVTFNFLIPGTTNHWFEVFDNHQIYLIIDSGDDLKYYDGDDSFLIDELATNQWHSVEIKAHPSSSSYDVYVDSQFKITGDMWIHSGYESSFRVGDRNSDQTYYDYGEAYWDDIVIAQPADFDRDGTPDPEDNCPYTYNPMQEDRNSDGLGDACECDAANLDELDLIDFFDFSILASDWQLSGSALQGDINTSGVVDFNDLEILAFHWLSNCNGE